MSLLPTEKSTPKTSLADYTVLIHGAPKIGKSTWCSQIENVLFFDMESGLNALQVYKTPLIETWEQLLAAARELTETDHPFKAVVWDTVEVAYQLCLQYVCKKNGIIHPGKENDYGASWNAVNGEFGRVITKLSSLEIGLFLISHSKEAEKKTRTEKYTKTVPNLSDGARKYIAQTVSTILYFTQREVQDQKGKVIFERVIYGHPSLYHEAGSRVQQLIDMPEVMPMDYAKFVGLFTVGEKEKEE